ncbi:MULTISPECIES: fimbrial protein [Rahnella]|uniref:Fimbrial protein n=1 Tax=Rahnella laticis TaxID=2787622 RepID=A0ABS0ED21_9GAMM|nr:MULTISPECIES: fimbrial protein [Rahnella]MBF7981209.1 fimbrial protein [Rahnella laticis]MBF8001301.1 fimbrial protein [Rahnella sp. LAC-M12]
MNIQKIVLILAMASGVAMGAANAKDQGHGTITFTGSIIDAPCSITPESSDQTIDLGQVSNLALKDGGRSIPQVFTIKLEQCDITTSKTVTTTFSGTASSANKDLLGLAGTAKGASIGISTTTGDLVKLGSASPAQALLTGTNNLSFAAYLQGDGASATIVPGSFQSVANFALDYP